MKKYLILCAFIIVSLNAWTWDPVGPEGGVTLKVSPAPSNTARAFAMTYTYVFRTENANTWEFINLRGSPRDILATTPLKALIVTDDSLYYSNDGGNTWVPLMPIEVGGVLSENRDTLIYLLANNTLYKCTDGGFNWLQVAPFGYDNPTRLEYAPSNSSVLYASVELENDSAFVLKSTDGGSSWTTIFIPSDTLLVSEFYDIEVNPWDENEVFLSPGLSSGPSGLIYSPDGGNTWVLLQGSPGVAVITPTDVEFISQDTILITNFLPQNLYIGIREGGGWIFEEMKTLPDPMALEVSGDTIYVATTRGVYVSFDRGATFEGIFNGYKALSIWRDGQLSQLIDERIFAIDLFFGCTIYRSSNGGLNWSDYSDSTWILVSTVELAPSNPLIVYAAAMGVDMINETTYIFHSLYKSEDGGNTFYPVDTLFNPDSAIIAVDLWISPDDPSKLLMYSDETSSIMISYDGGRTWTTVVDSVDNWIRGFIGIGDTIFFHDENTGTILRSIDGGESFTPFIDSIFEPSGLAYDPDEEELFFIKGSFLYRVLPDGTVADSFEIPYLFGGHMTVGHDNTLYFAGHSFGYFVFGRTGDDGLTIEYDTLEFFPGPIRASSSEILLSEWGKSLRRSVDAVIGVVESAPQLAPGLYIPSLVEKEMKISGLCERMPYEIKIYDVSGRLRKLLNVEGKNSFIINLKDLRSGVYLMKISSKGRNFKGKFVKISN